MATSPYLKHALELVDSLQGRPNRSAAILRHIAIHNPYAIIRAFPPDTQLTIHDFPRDKKIAILKILRNHTGWDLPRSLTFIKSESRVLNNLTPSEASILSKSLSAEGATVSLSSP